MVNLLITFYQIISVDPSLFKAVRFIYIIKVNLVDLNYKSKIFCKMSFLRYPISKMVNLS